MNHNTKQEKGFLLIPKEILTTVKYKGTLLSFPEKAVYSYLLHWSTSKEKVFPSMSRMCSDLGVGSRASMTKYLSKLEGLDLLSIERVKGKSSNYTVLPFGEDNASKPNKDSLDRGTNIQFKPAVQNIKVEEVPSYELEPFNPYEYMDDEDIEPPF